MRFQTELQQDAVRNKTKIRLMDGSQCLSSLVVYDLHMRIGENTVHLGGIGDVGTPPEHRKKGYATQCLNYSIEWMLKNDYDMSLLFGIKDFYWRFGYATCMCNYDVTMRTVDAETARRTHKARKMRQNDVSAITGLSQAANASRTGSIDRSHYGASPIQPGKDAAAPIVVVDKRGLVAGYACFFANKDLFQVQEIHAVDLKALESLLPAIAEIAVQLRMHDIHFRIPPDHPLVSLIVKFGGAMSVTWPYEADAMARIINLRSTIEKIAPTLESRLEEAGLLHDLPPFNIETDIGACAVVPDGGVLETADPIKGAARLRMPQRRLTQLIMGYATAQVLKTEKGTAISSSLGMFLDVMFPPQHAFCWRRDMF